MSSRNEENDEIDSEIIGDKEVTVSLGEKKEQDEESKKNSVAQRDGHGTLIAAHYNTEELGLAKRNTSRILYLRNFNNWIKSMLIDEYLQEIKNEKVFGVPIKVLDICCGKGGDLLKWRIGNIKYLICCDIASVAIENCQKRYEDMKIRNKNIYSAEFFSADVTKTRIREKYKDASIQFDLVSCQFAFHYCFESLPQAECMMRNVTECLQKGGYFIGTIPCAYSIVAKQKKSGSNSFGNDIYQISFDEEIAESYPIFGGKYNFHLDGVVDCPEFLVYFPALVKLAAKYDLKLVMKEGFQRYFHQKQKVGKFLMNRMSALETYSLSKGDKLSGSKSKDYTQAEKYCMENENIQNVGTLSEPEWEVASLYLVFAFQKT